MIDALRDSIRHLKDHPRLGAELDPLSKRRVGERSETHRLRAIRHHGGFLREKRASHSAFRTALTQTCPITAPPDGPFTADTWEGLHPGEVVHSSQPGQTILSSGGNPAVGQAFDPVSSGLACTTAPAAEEGPSIASYSLPTPTGSGYTLLGAPVVTADLNVTGEFAYIAARLVDVDPEANTKTLVARGTYRIDPDAPNGRQTFQLHANGWRFVAGHIPRLELLGRDAPYARPSNGVFSIAVSNLQQA